MNNTKHSPECHCYDCDAIDVNKSDFDLSAAFKDVGNNIGTAINVAAPGTAKNAPPPDATTTGAFGFIKTFGDLLGIGQAAPTAPNQMVANLIAAMDQETSGGQGAAGMYKQFSNSNKHGGLNAKISTADGDTLLSWDGQPGSYNFVSTGKSLSKDYGGNLKDMASYILSSGYQPTTSDAPYWTWIKQVVTNGATLPSATPVINPATLITSYPTATQLNTLPPSNPPVALAGGVVYYPSTGTYYNPSTGQTTNTNPVIYGGQQPGTPAYDDTTIIMVVVAVVIIIVLIAIFKRK